MDTVRPNGHLDTTPIPGTIHLVDLDGTINARHAGGSQTDIVLNPVPSADPDDPLNWSPKRKLLSTVALNVYTLTVAIASAAIYSVLVPIAQDTGLTPGELNAGTGYMFLAFGWGTLIWQPFALQYGKRPAYLLSMLMSLGIMVWVAYATESGQWIGSKVLQGFAGAPIESLCEISIAAIYFSHERGSYIGLYGFTLAGGSYFASVIAGFINDGQGWRWVMYWCAIFLGVGFVFCFFFMEETNYDRAPLEVIESTIPPPKSPATSQVADSIDPEKTSAVLKVDPPSAAPSTNYHRKTYLQKLSLLDKPRPNTILTMMYRPLIFLSFPVVAYAGFSYGSSLIWFNVLNATAGLILAYPPYNFSSSMVGASYVSAVVGVGIGAFISGFLGDKVALWLARRNNGVREPEHRLWVFSVNAVVVPGALLLWGLGAANHIHWFGLVIGMGGVAAISTIGLQLSISYCIDSYKELSHEAIVSVILVRNTMSFAVNYGITPWVEGMGLQNTFILAACVGLVQVLTFLVVVKYGKGWRKASRERYYRFVAEGAKLGLAGH